MIQAEAPTRGYSNFGIFNTTYELLLTRAV